MKWKFFLIGCVLVTGLAMTLRDSSNTFSFINGVLSVNTVNTVVNTPALGASGTNIVVDYSYQDASLSTTTNLNLSSFSNTPGTGYSAGHILRILADGGNVTVNSGLGTIKIANSSVTFPVVITNGDWGVFSFKSYGAATNLNGLAYSYVH